MTIERLYGEARTTAIRKCDNCGEPFSARADMIRKGRARFCSKRCSELFQRKRVKVTCAACQKEFELSPSRLKKSKSGLVFCSRICKDTAQQVGSGVEGIQPPHYGNGKRAYRTKALRYHGEKCKRCGWSEDGRLLQVHHIDRDRENNKIENLVPLCPNCHWGITLGYYELNK